MAIVVYQISEAKARFANQLIIRSISETESELDNYFGRITDLIHAVTDQYETGFWNGLSSEKIILHHVSLIQNYASVSSLGIADSRGYEFNIMPDSLDGYWLTRRVFVDRWGNSERWERWRLRDDLSVVRQWEESLEVDTRDRPWFTGAMEDPYDIFWAAPYLYTTSNDIGITAARYIPHQIDSLSRVVAVDLTLHDLNQFVDELKLTPRQNIFLLTSDNRQVIASKSDMSVRNDRLESASAFDSPVLSRVLESGIENRAFSFKSGNNRWWGILNPYAISDTRQINIVSILPEQDFAEEINRTLWIGVGSFFLILLSTLVVVTNHNKLHRISNTLTSKNKLISKQKQFLFAEVHHRVKNNLALISAFLELEILNMDDPSLEAHIQKNQRRIKIIAIIQEEIYQSRNLGSVTVMSMVSGILEYLERRNRETDYTLKTEKIRINVNQALTYGLLLNEILISLDRIESSSGTDDVRIAVVQRGMQIRTEITADGVPSAEQRDTMLIQDVARAYIAQLQADVDVREEDHGIVCVLTFDLIQKSGIVGNKHYKT